MLRIPNVVFDNFVAHLDYKKVPPTRFSEYKKWLRYYLDFCDKYPVPADKAERVRIFCEKLKAKKQSEKQREWAAHAISLYFDMPKNRVVASTVNTVDSGRSQMSSSGQKANSPASGMPTPLNRQGRNGVSP